MSMNSLDSDCRAESEVLVTIHALPFKKRYETYEWRGPRTGVVCLGGIWSCTEEAERAYLAGLPWKLRKLPYPKVTIANYYARVERFYVLSWGYHWLRARTQRITAELKWRIILTFYVWSMADVRDGYVASWRMIHLPRRRRRQT